MAFGLALRRRDSVNVARVATGREKGGQGMNGASANVLLMFLEMLGTRVICAPCLSRLTDELALTVTTWLETHVANGDVARSMGACLNCEAAATVYALAPRLT